MIYSICLNRSVVFLVKRANLHSPQRCSTQTLEATLDCNALFPQKSKHWHFPGFFTFTTGWYFTFIISTLVFNPSSQPAVLISRLFPRLQCGSGDLVTVSPLERLEKQQVATEKARGGSGRSPCRRRFSASISNLHVAHLFTGCFSLMLLNQIPDSFQLILPHLRLLTADLLMSPLCFKQLILQADWVFI